MPATLTEVEPAALVPPTGLPHFPALDGWRGISILLVLAAHLLPLGPSRFSLNASFAAFGMAIFFTLSGFLITSTLYHRPTVREFLIRRLCRIIPLAWLFSVIALTLAHASPENYVAQLLFFSNLPPFWLTNYTAHLWSLGVEVQFYLLIAAICALFGRRGLDTIPFLCLAVTAYRIHTHTYISIVSNVRMDEILAGGTLALVCAVPGAIKLRTLLNRINPWLLLPFAFAASVTAAGPLNYARPYLVAAMVGATLLYKGSPAFARLLSLRWLVYMAAISYAVYILHPMAAWGWLGEGTPYIRYAKRLPAMLAIWGLAHLSTFYFESFWINFGKRWSKRLQRSPVLQPETIFTDAILVNNPAL